MKKFDIYTLIVKIGDNMYRKLFIVVLTTSLFACSDNDLSYYQSHLDEAKDKVQECETLFKEAIIAQDVDELKTLSEDLECKAARKARSEYRRELAQMKKKQLREEQQKQLELDKQKFITEYKRYKNEFTDMKFELFYDIKKECNRSFYSGPSAKCKAFKELQKTKWDAEIGILIEKYDGDKLVKFNKEWCRGLKHNQAYCEISHDAVEKQRKDKIEYFLANRDILKTVFNKCQSKYKKLWNSRGFAAARQYIQTFQCSTVSKAAAKLRVFNFSKPIR